VLYAPAVAKITFRDGEAAVDDDLVPLILRATEDHPENFLRRDALRAVGNPTSKWYLREFGSEGDIAGDHLRGVQKKVIEGHLENFGRRS
jgi:hypothetical protein